MLQPGGIHAARAEQRHQRAHERLPVRQQAVALHEGASWRLQLHLQV